ncbi:MAG: PAS domain-containing protein [Planctomycetes bacterium]|nr:PAS domain-containing protein [Planctomycetota bacterium]
MLLHAFPGPAMVLDGNRQIVLANPALCELLGCAVDELIGRRPGEALGCVHASDHAAGCGTGPACRFCGAGQATVATAQRRVEMRNECRILARSDGNEVAFDLRVSCVPLDDGDERLSVFSVTDVSGEKRREVLERIFFHDVLNVAGGVRALAEILTLADRDEAAELRAEIQALSERLVDEILAQRDLVNAERGELRVEPVDCDAQRLLGELERVWSRSPLADGRSLRVLEPIGDTALHTDLRLLRRVLENLLKNALEASEAGGSVCLGFRRTGSVAHFAVHNETVMPESVRRQMFHRSFSTKGGTGRGVGTYSIRLLTTRYLRGAVSFESHEHAGTTFTVEIPAHL